MSNQLNLHKCTSLQQKEMRKMYIQSQGKIKNKKLTLKQLRKNPLLKAIQSTGPNTTRNRQLQLT